MDLNKVIKNNGLRLTRHRKIILEEIINSKAPISAEDIYSCLKAKDDNINLSTVYRTLNTLVGKNILLKNTNLDGIAYFQLNNHKHKHFITCIKCHKKVIIEECPIDEVEKDIENETGFKIKGHSFEFTGICPQCQKKEEASL